MEVFSTWRKETGFDANAPRLPQSRLVRQVHAAESSDGVFSFALFAVEVTSMRRRFGVPIDDKVTRL